MDQLTRRQSTGKDNTWPWHWLWSDGEVMSAWTWLELLSTQDWEYIHCERKVWMIKAVRFRGREQIGLIVDLFLDSSLGDISEHWIWRWWTDTTEESEVCAPRGPWDFYAKDRSPTKSSHATTSRPSCTRQTFSLSVVTSLFLARINILG